MIIDLENIFPEIHPSRFLNCTICFNLQTCSVPTNYVE